MNSVKRIPGLLTLSAVILIVNVLNPRRTTYAQGRCGLVERLHSCADLPGPRP
jgi:hypothetical protein